LAVEADTHAGSLYWLGLRDNTGTCLDGGRAYKLTVPLPVPGKLFWSVTVYDTDTRSQVQTDQGKAALRSLFELKDKAARRWICILDQKFQPTMRANGSRQSLAKDGLFTSAFTDRSRQPSTEPGGREISRRSNK
jgi:hypothetical protein